MLFFLFSTKRRKDSNEAYEDLAEKLFGRQSWKPRITTSEKELLDRIAVVNKDTAMPPGTVPNPSKKKIRPSSASANLQSHPDFKSGLYDNTRPTTASHGPSQPGMPARPRTQATGPKFWSKGKEETEIKPARRLTIGAVDGIGQAHQGIGKRAQTNIGQVGSMLKGKVGGEFRYISFC